ncbi:hypothetical protein [Streptomyces sp. NPDC058622]|uniref:hypothetical protein n=1 Tax=unclassified Streptomyces TaxID=2593676 RepID=UPI00365CEE4D
MSSDSWSAGPEVKGWQDEVSLAMNVHFHGPPSLTAVAERCRPAGAVPSGPVFHVKQ